MTPTVPLVVLALVQSPGTGGGDHLPLRGIVRAAENDQPVFAARVFGRHAREIVETDRQGRFVVWLAALPDTLVAQAIGRRPDTLVLDVIPVSPITITLALSPTPITAVTVYGSADSRSRLLLPATWSIPRQAMQKMPFAVETDVLRSLGLTPAIAFSSPISAQPLVRGQDAGAAGIRLDGFTLLNPYHIGRYLGAVPPSVVQNATVMTAPFDEDWGDATSGIVDIQLRDGGPVLHGGVQASLVTLSTWLGGSLGTGHWFAAARHAYLGELPLDPLQQAPYAVDDGYGRFTIPLGSTPLYVTAFGSRDRIMNRETDDGMKWTSRLVGARLPVNAGPSGLLELWGEISAFKEDVLSIPLHGQDVDVENRFATIAGGVRAHLPLEVFDLNWGAEVRRRHMVNEFTGGFLTPPDLDAAGWSGVGFAGVGVTRSRWAAHFGLRVEGDSTNLVFQPRARLGLAIDGPWVFSFAVGRSARLYHLIADPQPEPQPFFYDVWRPAGTGTTPIPITDHAVIEIKRATAAGGSRIAVFAGRLWGVGEVRPTTLLGGTEVLRFGKGRLYGLEAEFSRAGKRFSASASYVLSWSERKWPETPSRWIPWVHDRRHQARGTVAAELGHSWRLMAYGDVSSPEPLTPVVAVLQQGSITPIGVRRDSVAPGAVMIPGEENSLRGVWVGRVDLALTKGFTLGRARGAVGLSVLNLAFTRVAPVRPQLGGVGPSLVEYKPLYPLPPVPTLTFSAEF